VGDRVRVYRATGGRPVLWLGGDAGGKDADEAASGGHLTTDPASTREALEGDRHGDDLRSRDPRNYDVTYYARQLRDTFATRLVRAFTADDFERVFADPEQPSLFDTSLAGTRPILTVLASS
jgi:hypothetical protein